ncbi:MAG: hypothetical protein A2W99_15955 [Bacteroidetes bacterium GWF2_33_16]|nr:MAG: hypothetical protein A2X00_15300 [Bacteroidetes bacterium GWE2_32_14]OFY02395.1 MAG: hypothetical protein A2W99_15955 [Bacteroidetes bacterium GWF2_33_16]
MKKLIKSFESEVIIELKKTLKNASEGINLISLSELENNKTIVFEFIVATIVYTILLFSLDWDSIYWLYAATIIFSFFLAKIVVLIKDNFTFPKSFIYFDDSVIIKKQLDILEFNPITQLTKVEFVPSENKDYIIIKLIFNEQTFSFPYLKSKRDKLESFAKSLTNEANKSKKDPFYAISFLHSKINNSGKTATKQEPFYKKALSWTFIFSMIFLFSLTYFLDWNSFRAASKIDTATSLRNYLSYEKNKLYRDEAKSLIIEKYNTSINIYKSQNYKIINIAPFIKILEYLRDNEIFTLIIYFQNNNQIKDLSYKYDVSVVSAVHSFTDDKITERESELISTLNKTLGNSFPSDIIKIDDDLELENHPRIELRYTIENSGNGSLYYPVEQENLNESERTYYYGLTIYWDFKLFLPTQGNPIYEFSLISNPAAQFTSENNTSDNVYTNMVYSAFNDFEKVFRKYFFSDTLNN